MPFKFTKLAISDVILIEPKVFYDDRGFFMETYRESDFKDNDIIGNYVQDNYSVSNAGVIRGLHFQKNPDAQGKLVRVVKGKVFDVAVDIRQGSPTYAKWVSATLSGENHAMLWIPVGFAHGVCILDDDTHLLYKVAGGEYSPENERSVMWNDPDIGIQWPIQRPNISEKDQASKRLCDIDNNFMY